MALVLGLALSGIQVGGPRARMATPSDMTYDLDMAQFPLPRGVRPPLKHAPEHEPEPVHFPEEAEMPEAYAHLVLRTFLFRLLRFSLGTEHSVGSDQLVYWDGSDPKRVLSPDVFVRLGVPQTSFGSWKTWEQGGAPQLAVEIISPNEGDGIAWDVKLARYGELGVEEL